jgi:tetratricopeptide (TPR) repeat protein
MPRTLTTILIGLPLALGLLWANVWQRQQTLYREGQAGEQRGDFMVALTGYESAIRMYLPLSATVEHSAQRIWALGEAAEQRRDTERALASYRSLRSAFYATRWLRQPGEDWISRCDAKIAALVPLRKGNRP